MEKSPITGKSGAIRILPLTMAKLRLAERHGKREDEISKLRVVNSEKPVVYKGLNLVELYKKHTEGAFIPKGKTVVQHALFQFPAELVDGEDAEYMLHHSVAMSELIWGADAVIAARVDRDEKSRRVVDVFICPKYLKQTKRESKVAVSMPKHMKELADRYGHEKPSPTNIGRALQEFVYEYFRDVMKLDGVKRGSEKSLRGSDWKSAEKLREEELKKLKAEAAADREAAARMRAEQQALLIETANQKARADAEIEAKRTEFEEEKRAHAALAQKDKRETAQQLADAKAEHASAKAMRAKAEALVAQAKAESAQANRQKEEISRAMEVHLSQLALLARASDDASGLELRVDREGFAMKKARMSVEETKTHEAVWPFPLIKLGKVLAQALQALRDAAADLLRQKREVEEARRKDAKLAADQQAHHEKVLAILARERDALAAKDSDITQREARAEAILAEAIKREDAANTQLDETARWSAAVEWFGDRPMSARIGEKGYIETEVKLDPDISQEIAAWIKRMPPPWVSQQIARQHALDCEVRKNRLSKRLLKEFLAGKCDLKVGHETILITRSGQGDSKRPRMEHLKSADLALWFMPVAKSHFESLQTQRKAASLARQFDKRMQDLATRFPERRLELDQERKAASAQIGDGLGVGFRGFDDRGM